MNGVLQVTAVSVTLRVDVSDGADGDDRAPVIPLVGTPSRRLKVRRFVYELDWVTGREDLDVFGMPTTGRTGAEGETFGSPSDALVDEYLTFARGELLRLMQNGIATRRPEPQVDPPARRAEPS